MNVENVTEVAKELNLPPSFFTWQTLVSALILTVICLVIIKILLKIVDRMLERSKLEKSMHVFVRSLIKYLLLFFAILIIAASVGVNVNSLIALFSIFGLAVTLAMQGILSNLAGGFMVMLYKPFKQNDYVLIGDTEGTIKTIGLTHTQIDTLDNKLVFVPNSEVSSGKVTNFTAEEKRMVELHFSASYDSPVDEVYEALWELVETVPGYIMDPQPRINVWEYQNSSIDYLFRGWTRTQDYWTVYFATLDKVKRIFDAHGIEMTYDHINVHMIGGNDDEQSDLAAPKR